MLDDSSNRLTWIAIGLATAMLLFNAFNSAMPALASSIMDKMTSGISSNTTPVTHTAYAYSANGTDRFSTVKPQLNLLKGTNKTSSFIGNNSAEQAGETFTLDGLNKISDLFKIGDLITVSYDYTLNANTTDYNPQGFINFYLRGGNWQGFDTIIGSTTNAHISQSIIVTQDFLTTNGAVTNWSYHGHFVNPAINATMHNLKLEKGPESPWMPSASEVQPSDYPQYVGTYTDMNKTASTDPNQYFWSKAN